MAPGSQKEATPAESRLSWSGNRTCVVFAYRAFGRRPTHRIRFSRGPGPASPNCSSAFLGCLGAQCDCFVGAMELEEAEAA